MQWLHGAINTADSPGHDGNGGLQWARNHRRSQNPANPVALPHADKAHGLAGPSIKRSVWTSTLETVFRATCN